MPSNARRLTLDSIVDTALELIREQGLVALSMRRLAQRCGVGAMTLYGHVRTKDELLGIIADRLLAQVELPATRELPWQDQVRSVLRSVRRILLDHPELADAVARQHPGSVCGHQAAEVVLRALRRAGLDDERAVSALLALVAFTTALTRQEAHGGGQPAQRAQRLMAFHRLPADEFRAVVELGPLMLEDDLERRFEDGLDLLIRGIAARGAT